jgi:hypothetical protein
MTVDERFEQLEWKTQRLDKRNKRLMVALTMTATGEELGMFDTVMARHIFVRNEAGKIVVSLGANDGGEGYSVSDGSGCWDGVVFRRQRSRWA